MCSTHQTLHHGSLLYLTGQDWDTWPLLAAMARDPLCFNCALFYTKENQGSIRQEEGENAYWVDNQLKINKLNKNKLNSTSYN